MWRNLKKTKPMPGKPSFIARLTDLVAPRRCPVCGKRLQVQEPVVCASCNMRLPRTYYWRDPRDNEMARLFWGQLPIERAAALIFYAPKAEPTHFIVRMKYANHPEIGEQMGHMAATEMMADGFFQGIDCLVPVPLTPRRERERGYNQSLMIAQGISQATGLSIVRNAVRRRHFDGSQTRKNKWERLENVAEAFELRSPKRIAGKHILLIDDVVTSGATAIACGQQLAKAGNVTISILSLGFTKG